MPPVEHDARPCNNRSLKRVYVSGISLGIADDAVYDARVNEVRQRPDPGLARGDDLPAQRVPPPAEVPEHIGLSISLRDSALSAAYGRGIPCGSLTWDFCFRWVMMPGSGPHPAGAGISWPAHGALRRAVPWVPAHERRRAPWLWEITGYHTL